MGKSIIKEKRYAFAIKIVTLSQFLQAEKKEYVLSKQILRSGTSIGALIREAEFGQSKPDFIHKLSIAQKEINETMYWLELLHKTDYLLNDSYESINLDAIEIIKLITSSIKTAKSKD